MENSGAKIMRIIFLNTKCVDSCVDTKIRSMFEDRDEEAAAALCNDAKTTTCTYNANT